MPIPDFDNNNVLQPHLRNPTLRQELSPYPATIVDFVHKFSTSAERIQIMRNFIEFRQRMNACGIISGFQWLDGRFMQDIETSENRPPSDLDLVTFYRGVGLDVLNGLEQNFPESVFPSLSKAHYKLNHYCVDFGFSPDSTVEQTKHWLH